MKVSSFVPIMKLCSPTNLNKDEEVKLTKEEQTLEAQGWSNPWRGFQIKAQEAKQNNPSSCDYCQNTP